MPTNFNDSELTLKMPKGWIRNLQSEYASGTTLTVAAGECRDALDQINMTLATGVTINTAVVGVNGLDTGAIAASTPYAIYLLTDTSNILAPCAIASTSFSSPIMPTINGITYDAYRLIDWQMTGAGSTFLISKTRGNGSLRTRFYDTMVATAITAGASQTLAAIDLSPGIPPLAGCVALMEMIFTPNAAGNTCSFAVFGSTATVLEKITGQVTTVPVSQEIEIPALLDTLTPKMLYINSAATGALNALIKGVRYSL